MIAPMCPHCGSDEIQTTDKFDGTVIEPEECIHDFECDDCCCLFQIVYSPDETRIVTEPKEDNDDDH